MAECSEFSPESSPFFGLFVTCSKRSCFTQSRCYRTSRGYYATSGKIFLYIRYYSLFVQSLKVLHILQTPQAWLQIWEGPTDPLNFVRNVVSRALAVQNWLQKSMQNDLLKDNLNLSELFHADTFLSALKQQTARYANMIYNKQVSPLFHKGNYVLNTLLQGVSSCDVRATFS